MTTKTDFFFGKLDRHSDSGLTLNWPAILDSAKLVSPVMFTNQLNRLLRDVGEPVSICDSSSSPSFYLLLERLNGDDIAFIEIYTDHLDYGTDNRMVLSCRIYLLEGVLDFKTNWMADDKYARQLIDSLLVPLRRYKLEKKVFYNGALRQKLPVFNENHRDELNCVFGQLNHYCHSEMVNYYTEQVSKMHHE